jgi:N2,N2-dimethylguanosine tRNA methyltransferase
MALPSSSKAVPQGYTALHESTTEILIPSSSLPSNPAENPSQSKQVFLNPVQEYNRDLSVVAIRCWSELRVKEYKEKREKGIQKMDERKKLKASKKRKVEVPTADDGNKVRERRAFSPLSVSTTVWGVLICCGTDEIVDGAFCRNRQWGPPADNVPVQQPGVGYT